MGLYEGRGNIAKAVQNLNLRWLQTKQDWDDRISDAFEKKYIENIQQTARSAAGAMEHMAAVVNKVRSECE